MNRLFTAEECYKLYLSTNFGTRGDLEAKVFTFPGGEPHVRIALNDQGYYEDIHNLPIRIYHVIRSFNDFGILAMTVDAVRSLGSVYKLSLVLPYFPGARQDRRMKGVCEPLAVKVYADLINALKFDEVVILDAHSDVTPALINNCVSLTNHEFVYRAIPAIDYLLVSPDAGATKKTFSLEQYISKKDNRPYREIVQFSKNRNMADGTLSGFSTTVCDLEGQTCVVVDDICDGGATFISIAEILKQRNAGDLHLIVTHGIFSKGTAELSKHYKTIACTNSWAQVPTDGVYMYDILSIYDL